MASSGSFSGSIVSGHYQLRVDWSQAQNVSANTSTITAKIPRDSPGKNTGVGGHALLQGIFFIQESNPCLLRLLHCKRILDPMGHLGSPLFSCIQAENLAKGHQIRRSFLRIPRPVGLSIFEQMGNDHLAWHKQEVSA